MIAKKLKLDKENKVKIINSPDGFIEKLLSSEPALRMSGKAGEYDSVLLFVKCKKELEEEFPKVLKIIAEDGIFWINYPKKTSGIKSDLMMNSDWVILERYNYRPVAAVSIDETWTAIRVRRKDFVKSKEDKPKNPEEKRYIDKINRVVVLPEDMKRELEKNNKLSEKFRSLSFTHKKEYVLWIIEAKKPETREKRIKEFIKKLEK